jgi:hypothetical protein
VNFTKIMYRIKCYRKIILLGIFLVANIFLFGQNALKGVVKDEKNIPIPFAKVYVKNSTELRVQANSNGEYIMRLMPGEYFLVYSAIGYDDREAYAVIKDKDEFKDIQLFPLTLQNVADVEVSAKKSNPGREIMLKVVAKKEQLNQWNYPHSVSVYTKAFEKIDNTEKKEAKLKEKQEKQKEKKEKKRKIKLKAKT